ncbi:MAG: hypothetical protein JNK76_25395 [Planctomycetales bacterium]|nr:hypothetical protein [Planctomycetales bacterium]
MFVAVDDIGSGDVYGFTAFATSQAGAAALRNDAAAILRQAGLACFHGCEYRPSDRPAYEQFTRLIRQTLIKHGGFAVFQVMPRPVFNDVFRDFPERVSTTVVQRLGHPGSDVTDLMSTKAGALVWLTRFTQGVLRPPTMDVLVARDQLRDDALNTAVVVIPAGLAMQSAELLARLGNQYAEQVFPGGPRISNLQMVDARTDPIIQAADVIGNFGMNFLKSELRGGGGSANETAKATMFADAFEGGGAIPPPARGHYSVTSQNIVATATGAGSIKFELFAVEE